VGERNVAFAPQQSEERLAKSKHFVFKVLLRKEHEGTWQMNDVAKDNLYMYNSKELNTDHGLNWSDYGARWYDACVGRWSSVDPLAEKYTKWSPYNYVMNNPIRLIDPDGKAVVQTANSTIYTVEDAENLWSTWQKTANSSKSNKNDKPLLANHDSDEDELFGSGSELFSGFVNYKDPPDAQKKAMLEFWAGEFVAGRISQKEYLNVYYLAEEGSWALVKNVLFEYKTEIALSVLPVGKVVSGAGKITGWVKKAVFKTIDPGIQKKVISAIEKGVVSPGKQGIVKLTTSEAKATGYTYKIKILGKGGDYRIYGNQISNNHILFDKVIFH